MKRKEDKLICIHIPNVERIAEYSHSLTYAGSSKDTRIEISVPEGEFSSLVKYKKLRRGTFSPCSNSFVINDENRGQYFVDFAKNILEYLSGVREHKDHYPQRVLSVSIYGKTKENKEFDLNGVKSSQGLVNLIKKLLP